MSCAITRRRLPALRTLPSSTVLTLSCSPTRRMSWFLPLNANADVRAATRNAWILVSALMISSAMPSVKYSFSGSALMFTNGSTAIDLVWAAAWAGACNACDSCAAVLKRSAGSFASAFFTACAVQSGTLFCSGGGDRAGDTEVGEHRMTGDEQHVLGFHVAVHQTLAVRVVQRIGELARNAQRLVQRNLFLAGETAAQGLAFDEWHHVIEETGGVARVIERQDVGVAEARRDFDLAQEALAAERGRELRLQDLDGDRAPVLEILGAEHGRHAAATDLTLDRVAVGERSTQTLQHLGHGHNRRPGTTSRKEVEEHRREKKQRPRMGAVEFKSSPLTCRYRSWGLPPASRWRCGRRTLCFPAGRHYT